MEKKLTLRTLEEVKNGNVSDFESHELWQQLGRWSMNSNLLDVEESVALMELLELGVLCETMIREGKCRRP